MASSNYRQQRIFIFVAPPNNCETSPVRSAPAQLDCPQNNQIALPLCPSSFSHPILFLVRQGHSFLVDCCVFHVDLHPSKAATYFNFYIFLRLICCHQTIAKHPPLQYRALSDVSPVGDTNFRLVVVSPGIMTATYGHDPIPLSLNFCRFNLTTEPTTRRPPTRSAIAACRTRITLHHPCWISLIVAWYMQNGGHPKVVREYLILLTTLFC